MAKMRRDKSREQMSDAHWKWLTDQPMPDNFEKIVLQIDFHNNDYQLWDQHRDVILAEHIKDRPGTRPAHWWKYDAPRLPVGTFPSAGYDGELPEPRKRLSGSGTPAYEVRAVGPSFDYGIPDVWVDIDRDDPPMFEAQASYLKRHGMLFFGEGKRADFEPEAMRRDGWPI
jgi:hypothetical protein